MRPEVARRTLTAFAATPPAGAPTAPTPAPRVWKMRVRTIGVARFCAGGVPRSCAGGVPPKRVDAALVPTKSPGAPGAPVAATAVRQRGEHGGAVLRLIGVLLVLTAAALALTRAPDRPVTALIARWAAPPSTFVEVRGQPVHLRDEGPSGDPVPIVLLHGTSASLHTWEGWVRSLKGQRRVITLDLPGFGLTGPFVAAYRRGERAPDDYRGDTYARFVLDVMDTLQVDRAVVGGNSLGGEVAWRVASLAPQRVDRLVLVDAAGPAFEPVSVPLGFRVAQLPLLGRVVEHVLPRSLVAQSVANVYGDPSRVTPALVDRYYELTLRDGNRRALGQRMRSMSAGGDDARIAALRQPTLLLWGERDRLIPPSVGETFQRLIQGSRLVRLPGLGHVPQEEDPAASVAPVKAFLGLR